MQPLNIAICEDNANDAQTLSGLITGSGVSASIFVYENTRDFLAAYQPGFFQLVFLDIYFETAAGTDDLVEPNAAAGSHDFTGANEAIVTDDYSGAHDSSGPDDFAKPDGIAEAGAPEGLSAAVQVRDADPDVWIVFTTSSPIHARFGYKVKADRYLDKPLDEQEVLSLLERASKHFSDTSAEIVITVNYKKHRIKQRDILYVEVFDKKSMIHLKDETVETYMKIGDMEKLLTLPSFIRCHRCYIVNMDYIEDVTDDERDFIMKNGDKVYIGQNTKNKVKRAYLEFTVRLARGRLA